MAKAVALTKSQKLMVIIGISLSFFLTEIGVGFYTGALVLVADAFHYLNDLIGFIMALLAYKAAERSESPRKLSFGWQRATLLGAFFNGVFLLALGVSIFLQAIERFVSLQDVQNPRLVLIVGCVGFGLNVISAAILHEHDQGGRKSNFQASQDELSPATNVVQPHQTHRHETGGFLEGGKKEHDLGIMGVFIHVMGDAANNIGVIIAAAVIWKTDSATRFYADPAVSMAIALMIFFSSIPLVKKSGLILLESVPTGLDPGDVKHDIEQVPGVLAVHELHIWRLNQQKSLASAHITVSEAALSGFMALANTVNECFHAYGIHSVTLQPELSATTYQSSGEHGFNDVGEGLRMRQDAAKTCRLGCRASLCEDPTCCD